MDDLIRRQAAIGCLRDGQICGDYCRRAIEQLPPAQPHVYRGVTLNDVMMYFDSLEGNEDAWTEFCSCFECRGWGLYHIRSATEKNVGTNDDCISRQAAIDALWKALYDCEDRTEKQFMESDELDIGDWILHRIFVQNMSDIDRQTILNLPSAQPTIEPRAKGEWRMVYHNDYRTVGHIECDQCGYHTKGHMKYNFCPNCGADMRQEEEQ